MTFLSSAFKMNYMQSVQLDITQVKRVSTNDIVDPAVNTATVNTLTRSQLGNLTVTLTPCNSS